MQHYRIKPCDRRTKANRDFNLNFQRQMVFYRSATYHSYVRVTQTLFGNTASTNMFGVGKSDIIEQGWTRHFTTTNKAKSKMVIYFLRVKDMEQVILMHNLQYGY